MDNYISELSLSAAEAAAVNQIKDILLIEGFPVDNLIFKRVGSYVTIEREGDYPFCRLKLSGELFYISLCIGSARDIERLSADPRYSPLKDSTEKFTRFFISDPSDVSLYSEGIISAYRWICRIPTPGSAVEGSGVSPELSAFLALISCDSSGSLKFKLSADEIAFFDAYIKALSDAGLDCMAFRPCRTAAGLLSICGGYIKLQGRKTFMSYFPDGELPACRAENKTLPEYIELQKHWVAFSLKNPDLIRF